jgi:glycosyltransferase involved in cell wall biosynthesis
MSIKNVETRPIVSIIIPAFNASKFIGEQLESLHKQQYEGKFEIIVVDNLSTDSTNRDVEKFKQKMPNLSIVKAADKKGASYATNVGVAKSKGDMIIRIDADDVAADGWLKNIAKALTKYDFVAGGLEVNRLNVSAPYRTAPFTGEKIKFMGFLPYVIGCNMGFTRKAFNSVKGFNEKFCVGDDVDFSWRLQMNGYSIKDVPEALMHYRYRGSVSGMWTQTVGYATTHVRLYKNFSQFGMPKSDTRKALRVYIKLLKKTPTLFFMTKLEQEEYLRELAAYWGRFKGSLRYCTLYL